LKMALPLSRSPPVPSPRAAKAILVHKARGEGQGEGTPSILCNLRVDSLSSRGTSGERAGERGIHIEFLLSPTSPPSDGGEGETNTLTATFHCTQDADGRYASFQPWRYSRRMNGSAARVLVARSLVESHSSFWPV